MYRSVALPTICVLSFAILPAAAEEPAAPRDLPWGTVTADEEGTGRLRAEVKRLPEQGRLVFDAPFANVSRAYVVGDRSRQPLSFELNPDASQVTYFLPSAPPAADAASPVIRLETVEKTTQFADGRITLSALDAQVTGVGDATAKAKLETQPGNHRIGFWSQPDDVVRWEYSATRPGRYIAELTYSCAAPDGTEIEIVIGDKTLPAKLQSTGSWYRYTTLDAGPVAIAKPGKLSIEVRCVKKTGAAVMNLKALTLRPTSEGTPPQPGEDGVVVCHARDVTIAGVQVQWEPKPEKTTVGFWVNARDSIHWDFAVTKGGRYEVEILQGCGKGQGGSDVRLSIAGQDLNFVVEDTGHFQNFIPRKIGMVELQSGEQTLTVKPIRKAAAAVMDLRQVRLIPIE